MSDASQSPPPTGEPLSEPLEPAPSPAAGPPPGSTEPAWGAGRVFAGIGVLLLALILEVGVIAAFDPDLESLAAKLVLQAALGATLVAVAFFIASPGRGLATPGALGLRRPLRPAIGPALIAYVGYFLCAIVIALLLQPEQEDVTRELGVDEGTLGAIAAGILIIVVAPLTEEVFFRGFMFTGMRRSLPFLAAAAIPSVIWGLFHYTGPDSWGVVVQLAIFGLWLSWLYERTGSIWPTIAVHAVNNAIAFAILTS